MKGFALLSLSIPFLQPLERFATHKVDSLPFCNLTLPVPPFCDVTPAMPPSAPASAAPVSLKTRLPFTGHEEARQLPRLRQRSVPVPAGQQQHGDQGATPDFRRPDAQGVFRVKDGAGASAGCEKSGWKRLCRWSSARRCCPCKTVPRWKEAGLDRHHPGGCQRASEGGACSTVDSLGRSHPAAAHRTTTCFVRLSPISLQRQPAPPTDSRCPPRCCTRASWRPCPLSTPGASASSSFFLNGRDTRPSRRLSSVVRRASYNPLSPGSPRPQRRT